MNRLLKLSLPLMFCLASIIFMISTITLPQATLGSPYGPHYFPLIVSCLLFILSIIYLIKTWRELEKQNEYIVEMMKGRTPFIIISTLLLGTVYALIFEYAGFIVSTLLYLGCLLFIVNGKRKWKANLSTTIIFTFTSWYLFSELLNISLP
ncbi:tripartite tricarboxylate transporter TctB family protein [Alteribacillus sp. HJP-4]|uniref:tripartite tricarboxylate transporter TctB family protein n=1 Tax=Alteribacillus sp. HJP-4 TaxID=2775394 RepID=UPI0035CCE956